MALWHSLERRLRDLYTKPNANIEDLRWASNSSMFRFDFLNDTGDETDAHEKQLPVARVFFIITLMLLFVCAIVSYI